MSPKRWYVDSGEDIESLSANLAATVNIYPGDDVQEKIETAKPNDVVIFNPGDYSQGIKVLKLTDCWIYD